MRKESQKRPAAKINAAVMGDRTGKSDCPAIVVGIGVSAGGVKSLKHLFNKVPAGHGVAFVVIRHFEPTDKNLTVKLLKDLTALSVVEATNGMPVLADHIYLLPPDKFLSITGSTLTLQEPVHCNGLLMPIDHFFCSLAADQRFRGCGILLSGTGGDGTLGLSEIKAAGGRTFAEDPDSAEFPDMAQSAIEAGVVDAVLPIEAMVEAVVALADQVRNKSRNEPSESPEFNAHLQAILDILRAKVGHDYRCYKPNTLVRRIRRRMTLGRIETFAAYAEFLHEHLEEVSFLQKDLLIGVTEFFRQPQAWKILEEKVIAPLVDNAPEGAEIRVWVPGCSTGKEAYSLGMLLAEQMEKSSKKINIQIFATDSNVAALTAARSGIYSKEEIGENLSPERLKRFFVRKDGHYQVIKTIREQAVFAPQNLTADPPFSRLDLISCRNVLIYLDQEVQKKIVALFHFALREGGFLFLGNAETVGEREDLFVPVSKKWRIYRRIAVGRPVGVEIPVRPPGEPRPAVGRAPVAASPPRMSLTSMAQQMMLDRFVPAAVMIDRKLQVVYVHGGVEDYLTFPAGELTTRVVDMAREGLRARLRTAIGKCLQINRPVSVIARVLRGEKSVPIQATVTPLRHPREPDGLLLITFQDHRLSTAKSRRSTADGAVHQLQDELKVTREELQSTIEQLEASNDQLKASNEEVTATNEELQSANEEMETSKEELQSLNEELNAINARLHEKVEELESTNNDIVNLLSSTNIATVFLDKELRVRRYTPASTNLFSLISSDAGRPIGDVLRHFSDEAFLSDALRVLAALAPLAKEVQAEDGRWYIRRITPYRTQDDRIEGVVITFVDVCDLKETEEALRQSEERFRLLVEGVQDYAIFMLDEHGYVASWNAGAERIKGWTAPEIVGQHFSRFFPPELVKQGYPQRELEIAARTGQYYEEGQRIRKDGFRFWADITITALRDAEGRLRGFAKLTRDITERKRAEEALRESRRRLGVIVDSIADGFFAFDREWRITHVNDAALRHFQKTREEMVGRGFFEVFPAARGTVYEAEYRHSLESGEPVHFEAPSTISDRMMELHAYPGPDNMTILFRDVTERNRMVEALREAHERAAWLARFPEENPNPVARVSSEGNVLYRNPEAAQLPGWACEVGQPVPPPLLPLVGQAMREGKETLQDVELGGRFYSVSVSPSPPERYANVYGRDISDRKRAEAELNEATRLVQLHAAQLDAILETMTNPLLFYDPQGRPRKINNAAAALLGIDRDVDNLDEAALMAIWESKKYRDLDGRPMSMEEMPFRRALNGETVRGQVLCLTTADGREAILEVNAAVLESDGRRDGVVVVWHDITERKQAEQGLRESEAKYRNLFQNMTEEVHFWKLVRDETGGIKTWRLVDANPPTLRTWDKTLEEIKGKTTDEIFGPGATDHYMPVVQKIMTEGVPYSFEDYFPNLDKYFRFTSVPLGDYFITTGADITSIKKAEEAMRQGQQDLDHAQEVGQIGSWRMDVRRNVLTWSDENHRIFGVPKGTPMTYETFLGIIHPDDLPYVDTKWQAGLRGEPYDIEHRIVVGQRIKWVREKAYLEFDDAGKLLGGFGITQDITERKRTEEELRKAKDELELRVQERTEELAKSQHRLQQLASQLLFAQEKERKRVAVELHDSLLSELAAMKYLFEAKLMLLKKGQLLDTNEFNKVTDIMQKVIKDARGIMNNLRPSILDEMGLIPTIGWLTQEYQKAYGHIQIRKQVEVLEKEIPEVLKVVIFRVLQEALNNFARHGRGNLVELFLLKSGDALHLRIQDNGQGFDLGKVQKGLGLESMRERVEISGGEFRVESGIGQGTTIRAIWKLA